MGIKIFDLGPMMAAVMPSGVFEMSVYEIRDATGSISKHLYVSSTPPSLGLFCSYFQS